MDSKTLKALQFFYDRGPTPFLKLNSYLGEFSAEYRYLLATGMIERTHCGQMVEVTIAGRDAYERNNPSSKVNVISWIAIVLQFLNMILSPHDYSIPQMIKDCIGKPYRGWEMAAGLLPFREPSFVPSQADLSPLYHSSQSESSALA
ncbi:hypothetical protein [uncultured Megasphaera sp.]|uniref:hypothetical protein n=1 Tax=uncultured Megasphaera sp. TaxID=165188 RepID=UPI00266C39EF|nr:hypothetical protein [uncultured Megasphaera sp.]